MQQALKVSVICIKYFSTLTVIIIGTKGTTTYQANTRTKYRQTQLGVECNGSAVDTVADTVHRPNFDLVRDGQRRLVYSDWVDGRIVNWNRHPVIGVCLWHLPVRHLVAGQHTVPRLPRWRL